MTKISNVRGVNNRRPTQLSFIPSTTSYRTLWVILSLSFCSLISFSTFKEIRNNASPNINQPSSDTINNISAEEAILEDTKKYDEELLRMVQKRQKKGAKRGKIAWLMR